MKKQMATFFISLCTLTVICQETKLVTNKINSQIAEKYYILKSGDKFRHGEYTSFYTVTNNEYKAIKKRKLAGGDMPKEKGYYKFGKKDSLWTEYFAPERSSKYGGSQVLYGRVKSIGNYTNDKKSGIWLTYKNDVIERYDYDNNKMLQPYIQVDAVYPKSALEEELQGTVTVSFQIHKDCSVTDITVTKSLSADCDKSAIDAIKKISPLFLKYKIDCEEKIETRDITFKLH